MERTVKIKLPGQSVLQIFKTNADTFKELKQELTKIDFKNKRVVVRETRTTLQLDQAKLPDYDFTLFLQPLKVKSGVALDTKNFQQLRGLCKEAVKKDINFKYKYLKSNNTYGTATEMRISLNKFYKESNAVPEIKNTQKESIVVAKENVKSQVTTSESLELSDVINIHFTTLSKTVLEKVSFTTTELKQIILNTIKESQIALIKQLSDGISTISKSTEDFEEEYQAILQELHKENVIMK
jgi:hypothetical protein